MSDHFIISFLPSSNASATSDVKTGTTAAAVGGIYQTIDIINEFDTAISYMQDCASFISLASAAVPRYEKDFFNNNNNNNNFNDWYPLGIEL